MLVAFGSSHFLRILGKGVLDKNSGAIFIQHPRHFSEMMLCDYIKSGHRAVVENPMPRWYQRENLAQNFACERKQRQVTCPLDGDGHLALVFGAIASLAARADFAIFMDITAQ